MSLSDRFDMEEERLGRMYEREEISSDEYDKALSDLRREYRDAVEDEVDRFRESLSGRW